MKKTTTAEFSSRLFYPNPFKPAGIEFELPEEALVSLAIFDDSGNELKTLLVRKPYRAGRHQLTFDFVEVGEGKYFYRLSAEYGGTNGTDSGARNFVDVKRL